MVDLARDRSSTLNGSRFRHILGIVPSPLPLFAEPSSGPPGTVVSVEGVRFPDISELSCLFGGIVVPATFHSISRVTCSAPDQPLDSTDAATPLSVILAGSKLDFSHAFNAIEFQYNLLFTVFAIFPLYGPAMGGTVVRVQGTNFPAFQQIVCVFGGLKEAPAVFLHSKEVQCVTPKHAPGTVSVMIIVEGGNGEQEMTSQMPNFTFVDISTVQAVAKPSSGPQTGGTSVTVTFVRTVDFPIPSLSKNDSYCIFGDVKVSAHWQGNPTGEHEAATLTCTSPEHSEGFVTLSMYVGEFLGPIVIQSLFLFEPMPVISSVAPSHITAQPGTSVRIFIHGTGFRDSPFLSCRIGLEEGQEVEDIVVQGMWILPELIWCDFLTDSAVIITSAYSSQRLHVSVTNNGQDYSFESRFASVSVDLPWTLLGIWQTYGPNVGGTLVSIGLTGNPWHQPLKDGRQLKVARCKFGSAEPVPAMLSEDCGPAFASLLEKPSNGCHVISCKSPPSYTLEDVSVSISLNGGSNFWRGSQGMQFNFSYVEPLLVKNSTSVSGSALGGTPMLVHLWQPAPMALSKALTLGGPWCSFGDVIVPALPSHNEVSAHSGDSSSCIIACVSPSWALKSGSSETVNLLISSNGIDFAGSNAHLSFTYHAAPITTGLWPHIGSEVGGTQVKASGKGFHQSSSLSCIIRQVDTAVTVQRVPALWISDAKVLCVMPPHMPGPVEVFVATSEEMVNDSPLSRTWQQQPGMLFTYFPQPTINEVIPAAGFLDGGTPVSVFGSAFYHSSPMFCIFGDSWVTASYVSPSHLKCISPPAPLHLMSSPHHEVQVKMSVGYSDGNGGGSLLPYHPLQKDVYYTYFIAETIILDGIEDCSSKESSVMRKSLYDENDVCLDAVLRFLPRAGGTEVEQRVLIDDPSLRCIVIVTYTVTTISSPVEISSDGLLVKCALPPLQRMSLVDSGGESCVSSISLALNTSGVIEKIGSVALNETELKPWAVVTSVSPPLGSALGGTTVEVHIEQLPFFPYEFHPHHNAACLFGSVSTPAIWINRGELRCISPAMPPGSVSFTIDANAGAPSLLALSSVEFYVVPPSIALSVKPDNAPAAGGTIVIVRGTGFLPTVGLSCMFGSSNPAPATFISNDEVHCSTPSHPPSPPCSGYR